VTRRPVPGADFPGRLGGDEFLIVLADTDARGALIAARELEQAVAGAKVRVTGSTSLSRPAS
jgi:PleD family two-component response regulator